MLGSSKISKNTCAHRPFGTDVVSLEKMLDRAFSFLGIYWMSKMQKVWVRFLTFKRYCFIFFSQASYLFRMWLIASQESLWALRCLTPISLAMVRPAIKTSYSDSLLVKGNLKQRAYWTSHHYGLTCKSPVSEPLLFEAPSIYNIHYCSRSSGIKLSSLGSSLGLVYLIRKSANTCSWLEGLVWNTKSKSKSSSAHLAILLKLSSRCRIVYGGWSMSTMMVWAWKYDWCFLGEITKAKIIFFNRVYLILAFSKTQLT